MLKTILFEIQNRVATITLNRPETMNAINQTMRQELLSVMDDIETNDDIKVVILTAKGRGFSSGGDLAEGLAGYGSVEEKILTEYIPVFQGIQNSSKLYMTAIHGACTGIASGVALACDFAVMSDDAFLYVPFANLNLVPDGGISYQLVRHLGYKKALEIFTSAAKLPAKQCEQYGLVNRVVPAQELQQAAMAWATKLGKGAPLSHKLGKQCLQFAVHNSLNDVVAFEAKQQVTCTKSPDTLAAVHAMLNKQPHTFA